jgi:hypothetical protein
MDIAHLLGRYIRYLRRSSQHTQRVHSFGIAGAITALGLLVWLYFSGFQFSPSLYDDGTKYEVRPLNVEVQATSSSSSMQSVLEEAQVRFGAINDIFTSLFSSEKTFERASSTNK